MMMQHYLPGRGEFSDRVQSLRGAAYDTIGWEYRGSSAVPGILFPLVACGMLRSSSKRFNCVGELHGKAFSSQPFSLFDISAPIRQPDPEILVNPEDFGFQGVIISLMHNRAFLGRTIIRHELAGTNPKTVDGMKRVGLVDSRFEKRFEVYSDDQVEARALMTPDFMERLMTFQADYLGRNLQCAFIGRQLHIAVEIDDRFSFTRDRIAFDFNDACGIIIQEVGAVFDLLERSQTLQAAIGARGADGADQARREYYSSKIQKLATAVKASEEAWRRPDDLPSEMRHTHYLFCDSLKGLLKPRF